MSTGHGPFRWLAPPLLQLSDMFMDKLFSVLGSTQPRRDYERVRRSPPFRSDGETCHAVLVCGAFPSQIDVVTRLDLSD